MATCSNLILYIVLVQIGSCQMMAYVMFFFHSIQVVLCQFGLQSLKGPKHRRDPLALRRPIISKKNYLVVLLSKGETKFLLNHNNYLNSPKMAS